ncbi:MAG: copper homeostasis protein CutC [Cyclobacteriaceae bacterium]
MIIEVCVDNIESAIHAAQAGAKRIELCDNLFEGGTTPSAGAIEIVRQQIDIGLHVIIRPRGGDFLYSDLEMEIMRKDIEAAKRLGADGVVIGVLNADGSVDVNRSAQLVSVARPMSVTFHRAFDMTRDPLEALEDIISLGADRLLTSGQERSAIEGQILIKELMEKAGDEIIIMPGGGIDEHNIHLMEAIGAKECHVSVRKTEVSDMKYRNSRVYMGGTLRMPEFERQVTDPDRLRKLL